MALRESRIEGARTNLALPSSEPYLAGSALVAAGVLTTMWILAGGRNNLLETALIPPIVIAGAAIFAHFRHNKTATRELSAVVVLLCFVGLFAVAALITYAWWPVSLAYLATGLWSRNWRVLLVAAASTVGIVAMAFPTPFSVYGPGLALPYFGPLLGAAAIWGVRGLLRRGSPNQVVAPLG